MRGALVPAAIALLVAAGCAHGAARQAPGRASSSAESRLTSSGAPAPLRAGPRVASSGAPMPLRREYDQLNVRAGSLAQAAESYRGHPVALAGYRGGDAGNGYARGVRRVSWTDGAVVSYAISLYLPRGFQRAVGGQVDLLRWDNWPARRAWADWGGIVIWGSDRRARLLRFRRGADEDVLVGPFRLPEGRWFRLTVVQRLGAARAASEVYLDGRRVGRSLAANTYGRRIQRVRFGLVAIDSSRQRRALQLSFADPFVRVRG